MCINALVLGLSSTSVRPPLPLVYSFVLGLAVPSEISRVAVERLRIQRTKRGP